MALAKQTNPISRLTGQVSGKSLKRRLIAVAAAWAIPLLILGGIGLNRVISNALTTNFDKRLSQFVVSLIAASEIDQAGDIHLTRPLGDQRFFETFSGLYYQVDVKGHQPYRSRSLWDRALNINFGQLYFREHFSSRTEWSSAERLRVVERDAILPGSPEVYRFIVAERVDELELQVAGFRRSLIWSLLGLGIGLLALSSFQVTYGLSPLNRIRASLEKIRTGAARRMAHNYPVEIQPLANEINALIEHTEEVADRARTHAGNLAHALKTPMAVLMNEAQSRPGALADIVTTQIETMQRHVDHHLARARALGRQATLTVRTPVIASANGLKRALERIYIDKKVLISVLGAETLSFSGDKRDLEEILGNIMDNACKYGDGQVLVQAVVDVVDDISMVKISVEDNGEGIPDPEQVPLFERGVRLDEKKSGSGIGLSIVRDVAEIYGGLASFEASKALGGLCVNIWLPMGE